MKENVSIYSWCEFSSWMKRVESWHFCWAVKKPPTKHNPTMKTKPSPLLVCVFISLLRIHLNLSLFNQKSKMNNNGKSKPIPNHQRINKYNATTMPIMLTPKGERGRRNSGTTIDVRGNLLKHYFSCMHLWKRKKRGNEREKTRE